MLSQSTVSDLLSLARSQHHTALRYHANLVCSIVCAIDLLNFVHNPRPLWQLNTVHNITLFDGLNPFTAPHYFSGLLNRAHCAPSAPLHLAVRSIALQF